MHSVLEQKVLLGCYTVEEKRVERHAIFLCQLRIDRVELGGIVLAHVGRGHHAGKNDRNAALLQARQHLIEVLFGNVGFDTAQRVIRSQFKDDQIGAIGDGPIDARKPARGRVARHARILDRNLDTLVVECLFKLLRKGGIGRQQIARHEAVAETDNSHLRQLLGRQCVFEAGRIFLRLRRSDGTCRHKRRHHRKNREPCRN